MTLWNKVSNEWWRIVKQSDESSVATFDAEMAALKDLVQQSSVTGKVMETALSWLDNRAAPGERHRWAR